jgi:transcriptional regulator with XRE-family HTH domain
MHQAPTTYQVKGAAICRKRMQAGISVRHLADQVGCSASYLRKLERGTRSRMGPELYVSLRNALAAVDEELLGSTEG